MMSDGPKLAEKKRGSTKCKFIYLAVTRQAVICTVTTAILSIVFLVQIIVLASRPSITMPQGSLTCIPCNKMKSNVNTNLGQEAAGRSAIKQRNDGMCCGPVESLIQILLQMEMTYQYHYGSSGQSLIDIAEEYANCERKTNDKPPIAKVVGIVEFKPSDIVDGHQKVMWSKNRGTFYAKNFIHLELEGEIFIRQPGYYIVSSQLNLRRRNKTCPPKYKTRPTLFIHHVDLLSHTYGTTGVLMQTMKSIEINCGYFTSFLSAVFNLNKYDRLSVSVSNPELLEIENNNDDFLVYYTYDLPY